MPAKPLSPKSPVADLLLRWYDAHRRDLPWRAAPGAMADPYRVWLSEVMLQQTTVATVRPRFVAWVARWPDVASLAAADEAEVMAAWAGLGYYARARNLVKTARAVVGEHGGRFPATEAALRTLPGLGTYTAAAVAAIAFGERAVVVDANVERVVARLRAINVPLPAARATIRAAADAITPGARAGDFAQAMMDLGATICVARRPRCLLCPLRERCAGYASGEPERFPVKAAKRAKPRRYGTVFWLERKGNHTSIIDTSDHPRAGGGPVAMPSEIERGSQLRRPAQLGPRLRGGGDEESGGGGEERGGDAEDRGFDVENDAEVWLVTRPATGLLGGMRALPTGPWADAPPGLAGAPVDADWAILPGRAAHGFTHFDLELALAVACVEGHGEPNDGAWWPVADLATAGLPTVFAKAARLRESKA